MRSKPLINKGVFLLCFMSFGPALGLSSDRDQPIEIEADFAELDDNQRVAVYKGNVVVTQGSIRLNGDILTITYTPEHEVKVVTLQGKPARFRQRLDNAAEDTEGEAIRIEYVADQELLSLIEKAKVIREKQIYTGHRMVYDTQRGLLTLHSAAGASSSEKPAAGERVKIIIPPKERKNE
jgi:lipopolysaccharide export system protein LptA